MMRTMKIRAIMIRGLCLNFTCLWYMGSGFQRISGVGWGAIGFPGAFFSPYL